MHLQLRDKQLKTILCIYIDSCVKTSGQLQTKNLQLIHKQIRKINSNTTLKIVIKPQEEKKRRREEKSTTKTNPGVPVVAQWSTNPTRNHEVAGSIPALAQWGQRSGVAVSCGVGRRCGSSPTLLWLWHRLAATAPIGPLAWEPLYAAREAALEKEKDKKKKNSYSNSK